MFNWSSLWLRAARGPPTSGGRSILAALSWARREAAHSHTNLHWCSTNSCPKAIRISSQWYWLPSRLHEARRTYTGVQLRVVQKPANADSANSSGGTDAANDQPFFFRRESARNIGKNSGAFKMISALSTVLMPSKCSCSSSRSIAENNLGQNFFMAFKAT